LSNPVKGLARPSHFLNHVSEWHKTDDDHQNRLRHHLNGRGNMGLFRLRHADSEEWELNLQIRTLNLRIIFEKVKKADFEELFSN
jgi:hypothetical protein